MKIVRYCFSIRKTFAIINIKTSCFSMRFAVRAATCAVGSTGLRVVSDHSALLRLASSTPPAPPRLLLHLRLVSSLQVREMRALESATGLVRRKLEAWHSIKSDILGAILAWRAAYDALWGVSTRCGLNSGLIK